MPQQFEQITAEDTVLCAGNWCLKYGEQNIPAGVQYQVLDYHWVNQSQMHSDFLYLRTTYKRYLKELSKFLNQFHQMDKDTRYWETIAGAWLRYFIEILFDRYQTITKARKNEFDIFTGISTPLKEFVPYDFREFQEKFSNDEWNHFIFQEILKHFEHFPTISIEVAPKATLIQKSRGGNHLLRIYHSLIKRFEQNHNSWFFQTSYFSILNKAFLHLGLLQVPILNTYSPPPTKVINNISNTRDLHKIGVAQNDFEKCLEKLLIRHLPFVYLEDFNFVKAQAQKKISRKVKFFVTDSSFNIDEYFKVGYAEKISKGAKLFIIQHGGSFGTVAFSNSEEHQLDISDRYISWGWGKNNSKIIPFGLHKNIPKAKACPKNKILLILGGVSRYSNWMFASPTSSNFTKYIQNQLNLCQLVSQDGLTNFKVRLYPSDYGWNIYQRLVHYRYSHMIDKIPSYWQSISESKLVICSYNATTFLETMTAGVPTLIFWKKELNHLRKEAEGFFQSLETAGIMHYTVESLFEKVKQIKDNPAQWWNSKSINTAINQFLEHYACKKNSWQWLSLFKKLSKKN